MTETSAHIRVLKKAAYAVPVFATTLLVSSTLLFLIQPMVGKMILPLLGGTPAVWNTCMVFFQAALLAGYCYAHTLSARFEVRRQVTIHLTLLFLPLLILPIDFAKGSTPPTDANPTFWLLWRLLLSVGLPFFVISTSAPLLQKWFSGIGHQAGRDPYFLYATSNLGSLVALLGYPLLMERAFPVALQSHIWSQGYVVLIVTISLCAIMVWGSAKTQPPTLIEVATETGMPLSTLSSNPTVTQRLWWVFLAFVPSSLMLSVTTHITTNLAPIPLLWVIPLAIYLLTFIFVFARKPPISRHLIVRLFPFVFLSLLPLVMVDLSKFMWLIILANLLMFFVAAMMCHSELAQRRPAPKHLTGFYLWMSVGGVLGGVFNAIIAPLVFKTVTEYVLGLALTCMILPAAKEAKPKALNRWLNIALPVGIGLLSLGLTIGIHSLNPMVYMSLFILMLIVLATFCFYFKILPIRFGLSVLLLIVVNYPNPRKGNVLHIERNFFGMKKIFIDTQGKFHKFAHGNTIHGIQCTDPQHRREPLSYYHRTGPVGDIFGAFSGPQAKSRVAIVGLGIGSMAGYAEPGQRLTFYEIDPGVVQIATNPKYFTFLSDCRGTYDVVLGDGRLQLSHAPDQHYGMIILDAFSSDAIPVHLLSHEALKLYLNKLDQCGVLVYHISNRYLDLAPVLGNLAHEKGLVCLSRFDLQISEEEKANGKSPSHYVVMARTKEDLGAVASNPKWKPVPHQPDVAVWTDQYSNVLGLYHW